MVLPGFEWVVTTCRIQCPPGELFYQSPIQGDYYLDGCLRPMESAESAAVPVDPAFRLRR